MSTIKDSIEVAVPAGEAYLQWTRFEQFPRFMDGVEEVRRLDDTHLRWRASIGGENLEWDAEITEQIPGRRVAWRSTSGPRNTGRVDFEPLSVDRTRLDVEMFYDPQGFVQNLGDALGVISRRVRGDLEHFKELVEGRRA